MSFQLCFSAARFLALLYISVAQHPAALQAGVPVAEKFFPPMYGLAAPMQIICAVGGTGSGLVQWYLGEGVLYPPNR